jgi:hypothetical protein
MGPDPLAGSLQFGRRLTGNANENLSTGFLALSLPVSTTAMADQSSEAAAEQLLESVDMQAALEGIIDLTLDGEIARNPEMAPYKMSCEFFRNT